MCHTDQQRTEALPLGFLGIRTALKEDLQASAAELVYGESLRIPGDLLTPSTNPVDSALLITELRQHMARLRPVPAACHASPATFMHSDLEKCTHVFLHQVATRRGLEPHTAAPTKSCHGEIRCCNYSYGEGRHRVRRQGQASLHTLREQPREQHEPTNPSNPGHSTACHATTALYKNNALRLSHPFPLSLQHLSNHLRGGGGG
jgi:hypothetical protein